MIEKENCLFKVKITPAPHYLIILIFLLPSGVAQFISPNDYFFGYLKATQCINQ